MRVAGDDAPGHNRDVWIRDLARDTITRFTTDPAQEGYPIWSPDGSRIAFHSKRRGTFDLWIKPWSGASVEELLLEESDNEWPIDWSRDGRFLLYQRSDLKAGWDLWALPMTGDDRTPVPVATTPFAEHMGEFSPGGRWVVFDTNESGRSDIVIQAFPQARERLAVSTAGGTEPRWSADGTEIYYVALDGNMMAVPVVVKGSTLELGSPVALFFAGLGRNPFRFEYAVSRDGRFLRNHEVADAPPPPITIILDPKL
jgi:Tol biopolymer transport system component